MLQNRVVWNAALTDLFDLHMNRVDHLGMGDIKVKQGNDFFFLKNAKGVP